MKYLIYISFIFYLTPFIGASQISFEISYSTGRNDQARAIVQTNDIGYAVVGSTVNYDGNTDLYLMKVDSVGAFLWAKRYGGYGMERGEDIIETHDGGLAFVGYGQPHGDYDMYVLRTDNMGDTIFTKYIGDENWNFGHSIIQTSDKGFVIAGETYINGSPSGYLVKIDSMGTVVWEKTFGGTQPDKFYELVQSSNGDFIMAGESESFGNGRQAYVVRTDSLGVLIWENNYGNPGINFAKSLVELPSGEIVLSGGSNTPPEFDIDNWGAKINSAGLFFHEHIVTDYTSSLPFIQNDDWNEKVFNYKDSLVFAGFRTFDLAEPGNINFYRYTQDIAFGDRGGFQKFISSNKEIAYDGQMTSDNGMILACTGDFMDGSQANIYLIKVDSNLSNPLPFFNSISYQDDITSINEPLSQMEIEIYPNPTQNEVTINLSSFKNEKVRIRVFDIYGKLIQDLQSTNSIEKVDFSSSKSGMYLISIESKDGISQQKVIVTK